MLRIKARIRYAYILNVTYKIKFTIYLNLKKKKQFYPIVM